MAPLPPGTTGYLLGTTAFLWLVVTAYGSYNIGFNWFVKSLHTVEGDAIALTFDDGPDPVLTPRVLSLLKEENVYATFFLIGEKAEQYPEVVRQIQNEGHAIGNHSYSHSRDIGFFSRARLAEDLAKCSRVLESLTRQKVRMFRPPFGVTNPRYRRVLADLNMISVGWTLRSYDTVIKDSVKLERRLIGKLGPGKIVLLHDTMDQTVTVLPAVIAECKSRGINFVKLS